MKLQLYVQQVNNALEETSQQVLASLPKIIRDTKNLQQEAMVLKEKMAAVREEIEKIEHDTGKSINIIERLDFLKNMLNIAKQGLHESDNWTVLGEYICFINKSISISFINLDMDSSLFTKGNPMYCSLALERTNLTQWAVLIFLLSVS